MELEEGDFTITTKDKDKSRTEINLICKKVPGSNNV